MHITINNQLVSKKDIILHHEGNTVTYNSDYDQWEIKDSSGAIMHI